MYGQTYPSSPTWYGKVNLTVLYRRWVSYTRHVYELSY
jgi:hypothetical protein